jgi:nucleoside phosphorylase
MKSTRNNTTTTNNKRLKREPSTTPNIDVTNDFFSILKQQTTPATTTTNNKKYDYGILTILHSEFQGIKQALEKSTATIEKTNTQTISGDCLLIEYQIKKPTNNKLLVVCYVGEQGQHTIPGAIQLLYHQVKLLALVGTSGQISSDVAVYDVVVATDVDDYDHRMARTEYGDLFSGFHTNVNFGLNREILTRIKFLLEARPQDCNEWVNTCQMEFKQQRLTSSTTTNNNSNNVITPKIHTGIILSGKSIIKTEELKNKLLKERGRHGLCVDTESSMFATEMNRLNHTTNNNPNHFVPFLIVRGISDGANASKNELELLHTTTTTSSNNNTPPTTSIYARAPNQVTATFNATTILIKIFQWYDETIQQQIPLRYVESLNRLKQCRGECDVFETQLTQIFQQIHHGTYPTSTLVVKQDDVELQYVRINKRLHRINQEYDLDCILQVLGNDKDTIVEKAKQVYSKKLSTNSMEAVHDKWKINVKKVV